MQPFYKRLQPIEGLQCNKMDLNQLPWFAIFNSIQLYSFTARGLGQDSSCSSLGNTEGDKIMHKNNTAFIFFVVSLSFIFACTIKLFYKMYKITLPFDS